MRLSSILALSLRMAARDLRAGELGVLIAALAIAVAGVTTVSLFGDRVQRALKHEANALLGADLVVSSGRELPGELLQEAKRLSLATASTVRFPSMALAGEESALSDVRAVPEGYPLRGEVRIADQAFTHGSTAAAIPARGSVWVDDKLSARLKLDVGDTITLGESEFRVDALITHQPGVGIGFLSLAPSLMMNREDLAQTGLMQTGARARFSLLIAGLPQAIETFRAFVEARADSGIRVEGVRDARPEIKAALERAERFLGLAALASVLLAAAAVALAARRYLQRHLDACAMMRCLGASQRLILTLFLCQFVVVGLSASVLGCLIGAISQEGLAALLAPLARVELPPPGVAPALRGVAAGFALLLGFAFPPLMTLKRVPPLRVLRRDLKPPDSLSAAGYVLGAGLIVAMILWQANELRLGLYVLGGTVGAILVSVIAGYALLGAAAWAGKRVGGSLRIGLANLRRRRLGSLVQIAALSLGLMALLLLTLVRGDLLRSWQASIPPDAPNRFIVNIQPDQLAALEDFFVQRGMPKLTIFPMVRGRLIAINEKPVSSDDYADDRAKRLIDREFNLSWATRLQPDNTIVAGRFWTGGRESEFSVEEGIAQTLGMRLGDRLTYDVAGARIEAPVT
ncbi:MAG TPA: FtsX-like permease family protein, partial [Burkholderiales bacterium]|nr:FtsX-like permease family protein [Burkholderiales bacterium]